MSSVRKRPVLLFLACLAALVVFRAWFNGAVPLSGEEAYYWTWSRHLDIGYFDHPPLTAWAIWLATKLFGQTALGVRIAALAFHTAGAVFVLLAARRAFGDWTTAAWAGALFTATLFFAATATVVIPDSALFCCWALAVWLVLEAMQPGRERLWVAVGGALGLCALAKFHAILLAAAIGLVLVVSPRQRRLLRSGWLYLGGAAAILVSLPVFLWNLENGWATFGFQLAERHKWYLGSRYVSEMLGAPFGYVGILTYPLCIAAAIWGMRRGFREERDGLLFLSFACLVPICFFLALSVALRIDPQWAAPGYISALALAAGLGMELARRPGGGWWKKHLLPVTFGIGTFTMAVAYAAVLLILTFPSLVPEKLNLLRYRRKLRVEHLNRIYGWEREIGSRIRDELNLLGGAENSFVISQTGYGTASCLQFYTPGHPDVFIFDFPPAKGHQFHLWERKAALSGKNALVVGKTRHGIRHQWLRAHFESVEEVEPIEIVRGGRLRHRLVLYHAREFKGQQTSWRWFREASDYSRE